MQFYRIEWQWWRNIFMFGEICYSVVGVRFILWKIDKICGTLSSIPFFRFSWRLFWICVVACEFERNLILLLHLELVRWSCTHTHTQMYSMCFMSLHILWKCENALTRFLHRSVARLLILSLFEKLSKQQF